MPKQKSPSFHQLATLGYPVVPIVPPGRSFIDKKGKTKTGGKTVGVFDRLSREWSGMAGWQQYLYNPATDKELERWSGWYDNQPEQIGILTGDVVAIDIDITDEAFAKETQQLAADMLGDTPFIRFGKYPKLIMVYRSATRFRKILSNTYADASNVEHQIEVLGEGQQFVSYGIHPNTKKPYQWPCEQLTGTPASELPRVDKTGIHAFIDAWRQLARKKKLKLIGRDKSIDQGEHITSDDLISKNPRLKDAVNAIKNKGLHYDEWVRVGMAIKAATDDEDEAFELFDAFSRLDERYDAQTTREKFDSFNPTQIGAGTIYYLAEQNGFDAKPDPTTEFTEVDLSTIAAKPNDLSVNWLQPIDVAKLPPRQWVLGKYLLRGQVTTLVAPGGVGKSTLTLGWAASIATLKDLMAAAPHEHGKVWVINNEDDETELYRRFAAVQQHFDIAWKDLSERLILSGRGDRKFRVASRATSSGLAQGRHVDQAIDFIRTYHISTLIVDPMVGTHDADENNNAEMEIVMDAYRRIAREGNCAVCVVHHTSKPQGGSSEGFAGNANASRGASAVINAARVSLTLFDMSMQDAERFGVPEQQRNRYARLDDAKANLALRSGTMSWFYRETVKLENGDDVGVLRPITLGDRHMQRVDALVEEVAKFVLGEPEAEVSVVDCARYLMSQALWSDCKLTTLRRQIAKAFEMGAIYDNKMIRYSHRPDMALKEVILRLGLT